MNAEMMEALQALAVDKGISVDALFAALADALESAYKRMPDAQEYAWVTIDPDTMDIRVMAQELDEEGDPIGEEFDVTPDNFGRIAAQTARQVMTQRIREADGYRLKRINEAEGDAARFNSLLSEYAKAPEVTKRRIYIETMQEVMPKLKSKVIVDGDTQGILPLLNLGGQTGVKP